MDHFIAVNHEFDTKNISFLLTNNEDDKTEALRKM